MKKYLLINLILFTAYCLLATGSQAEMTSGSYRINIPTISGGGEEGMTSGSYRMQDLKGQGVIGGATSGSYGLGLGGVYGTLGVSPAVVTVPPTLEIEDNGWIRGTNITRDGNDLELSWGYDPARGATGVTIYYSSGPNAVYAEDPVAFSETVGVASGTTTYRFSDVAHDGNNYYFRIVPARLPAGTDIFSSENNNITVGKVETVLPANSYVFASLPFQEDYMSLASLISEQLGDGGEFLWWDGGRYHGATYSRAWRGEDRELRVGEGFILRSRTDTSVALVGRFGMLSPFTRDLPRNQYHLVSYPYPIIRRFSAMGIAPSGANELLRWLVESQAYEGATYTGGRWVGPAGINDLELAKPRYYRSGSNVSWTIVFP